MKSLVKYILEQMKAEEAILNSIKTDGLKRENMISILMQNDMNVLKKISDILKIRHKNDYFPYELSKDDFLNDNNKEKICGQIVDAVLNLEK